MKIFKEFTFEAAHKLPLVPKEHKCFNLHGHSFKVKITIDGPINEMGWVMDFSELKKVCSPYSEQLDHSYLNEIDVNSILYMLWKLVIQVVSIMVKLVGVEKNL